MVRIEVKVVGLYSRYRALGDLKLHLLFTRANFCLIYGHERYKIYVILPSRENKSGQTVLSFTNIWIFLQGYLHSRQLGMYCEAYSPSSSSYGIVRRGL